MSEQKKIPYYIVYDNNTYLIYCFTKSSVTAHSLSLGILNSDRAVLQTDISRIAEKVYQYDIDNDLLQTIKNGVRPFPQNLITPELLKTREIAKLRLKYFFGLESYLRKFLTRSTFIPDRETMAFMIDAVNNSDPKSEIFSPLLKEYAHVLNLDYKSAYQELKLIKDNAGMIKIRIFAEYTKYVDIINNCNTQEELNLQLHEMDKYFFAKHTT